MVPELQIDGNDRFESRWLVFQWIVLAIMACFVLAALAGVSGTGPFSKVTRTLPVSGATVQYARFETVGTASHLFIDLPARTGGGPSTLTLSSAFLKAHDIQYVQPQPLRAEVGGTGTRYVFARTRGDAGTIALSLSPARPGVPGGTLSLDGETLPLHQLVLP